MGLCGAVCHFVALWFLIHRSQVLLFVFGAVARYLRDGLGWKLKVHRPDVDVANDFVFAVLLFCDYGYHLHVRLVLTALTAPLVLGMPGTGRTVTFSLVAACLLFDWLRVVAARPPSTLDGAHVNNDFKVLLPEGTVVKPRHWIAFNGSMCAVFYFNGLMHGIYKRYGKDKFAELGVGYCGASSGSYTSAYAGPICIHGPYDCEHWTMTYQLFAVQYFCLMPLGLVFSAGTAIKQAAVWTRQAASKYDSIRRRLTEGNHFLWLVQPSIDCSLWPFRFRLRPWRRVVDCGHSTLNTFGDEMSATGCLPILVPGIHWGAHGIAVDGFLNFKVTDEIECRPPDMSDPKVCPGKRLIVALNRFTCLTKRDDDTEVLIADKWRTFSLLGDYLFNFCFLSDGEARSRRLFEWGVEDVEKHSDEIDAKVEKVFGLRPLA